MPGHEGPGIRPLPSASGAESRDRPVPDHQGGQFGRHVKLLIGKCLRELIHQALATRCPHAPALLQSPRRGEALRRTSRCHRNRRWPPCRESWQSKVPHGTRRRLPRLSYAESVRVARQGGKKCLLSVSSGRACEGPHKTLRREKVGPCEQRSRGMKGGDVQDASGMATRQRRYSTNGRGVTRT